eukprot:5015729-Prymnesium_polylepis.1
MYPSFFESVKCGSCCPCGPATLPPNGCFFDTTRQSTACCPSLAISPSDGNVSLSQTSAPGLVALPRVRGFFGGRTSDDSRSRRDASQIGLGVIAAPASLMTLRLSAVIRGTCHPSRLTHARVCFPLLCHAAEAGCTLLALPGSRLRALALSCRDALGATSERMRGRGRRLRF